jgi:EmrB/QacA subfamily drug resistance transporter
LNLHTQKRVRQNIQTVTLVNAILGIFIAGLSTRIFMISLPTVAKGLGTDILGISWALIAYQVAGIGLGVICGRLGDIYGHERVYGFGIVTMAISSLLCGASQDVFQLIAFRFVQGMGAAIVQSCGRTLGFRAMPEGSEGKAQGLMAMSHQFGFFVGPPIGGLIIDLANWRWIFFFLLFLPSLAGVVLTYMVGRSGAVTARHSSPVDYVGAFLFLLLTVLLTMLLDQRLAQVMGMSNRALLALVLAGTLWGFISHEKQISSPMIDLSFFAIPNFGYGAIGLLMACVTQGLTTFVTPFYLQDILRLSPTFMGILFLAQSVLNMAFAPVSGAMTDRIGARLPLIIGVVFLMVAFFIGANLQADSHPILPAVLLAFTGFGSAFFNTPSQAAMVTSLPKEHWGTAVGIINAIFGLGHLLGISLSAILLTIAFRYYSGEPAATPNPGDGQVFVASMNVTYAAALGISVVALLTSVRIKGHKVS